MLRFSCAKAYNAQFRSHRKLSLTQRDIFESCELAVMLEQRIRMNGF